MTHTREFASFEIVRKRKVSIPRWEASQSPTRESFQYYSLCSQRSCPDWSALAVVWKVNLPKSLGDSWSFPDGFIQAKTLKQCCHLLVQETLNFVLDFDLYSKSDRWGSCIPGIAQTRLTKMVRFSSWKTPSWLEIYLHNSSNVI